MELKGAGGSQGGIVRPFLLCSVSIKPNDILFNDLIRKNSILSWASQGPLII